MARHRYHGLRRRRQAARLRVSYWRLRTLTAPRPLPTPGTGSRIRFPAPCSREGISKLLPIRTVVLLSNPAFLHADASASLTLLPQAAPSAIDNETFSPWRICFARLARARPSLR